MELPTYAEAIKDPRSRRYPVFRKSKENGSLLFFFGLASMLYGFWVLLQVAFIIITCGIGTVWAVECIKRIHLLLKVDLDFRTLRSGTNMAGDFEWTIWHRLTIPVLIPMLFLNGIFGIMVMGFALILSCIGGLFLMPPLVWLKYHAKVVAWVCCPWWNEIIKNDTGLVDSELLHVPYADYFSLWILMSLIVVPFFAGFGTLYVYVMYLWPWDVSQHEILSLNIPCFVFPFFFFYCLRAGVPLFFRSNYDLSRGLFLSRSDRAGGATTTRCSGWSFWDVLLFPLRFFAFVALLLMSCSVIPASLVIGYFLLVLYLCLYGKWKELNRSVYLSLRTTMSLFGLTLWLLIIPSGSKGYYADKYRDFYGLPRPLYEMREKTVASSRGNENPQVVTEGAVGGNAIAVNETNDEIDDSGSTLLEEESYSKAKAIVVSLVFDFALPIAGSVTDVIMATQIFAYLSSAFLYYYLFFAISAFSAGVGLLVTLSLIGMWLCKWKSTSFMGAATYFYNDGHDTVVEDRPDSEAASWEKITLLPSLRFLGAVLQDALQYMSAVRSVALFGGVQAFWVAGVATSLFSFAYRSSEILGRMLFGALGFSAREKSWIRFLLFCMIGSFAGLMILWMAMLGLTGACGSDLVINSNRRLAVANRCTHCYPGHRFTIDDSNVSDSEAGIWKNLTLTVACQDYQVSGTQHVQELYVEKAEKVRGAGQSRRLGTWERFYVMDNENLEVLWIAKVNDFSTGERNRDYYEVANNPKLTTVFVVPSNFYNSFLSIHGNPSLTDLQFLSTSAYNAHVEIRDNVALELLDFSLLESSGFDMMMIISGNSQLTRLRLPSKFRDYLEISDNPQLKEVDFHSNMLFYGTLLISNNDQLTNLTLVALAGEATISNNRHLTALTIETAVFEYSDYYLYDDLLTVKIVNSTLLSNLAFPLAEDCIDIALEVTNCPLLQGYTIKNNTFCLF